MRGDVYASWRVGLIALSSLLLVIGWVVYSVVFGPVVPTSVFSSQELTPWLLTLAAALLLCISQWTAIPAKLMRLVPVAIAGNILTGTITSAIQLPFYFDTFGTFFMAIVGGPAAGILVAMGTGVLWSIMVPDVLPFTVCAVVGAALVGWIANRRGLREMLRLVFTGMGIGVVTGLLAGWTGLVSLGQSVSLRDGTFGTFLALFTDSRQALVMLQALIPDVFDKAFILLVVCLGLRFAPPRVKEFLVYARNTRRLSYVLSMDGSGYQQAQMRRLANRPGASGDGSAFVSGVAGTVDPREIDPRGVGLSRGSSGGASPAANGMAHASRAADQGFGNQGSGLTESGANTGMRGGDIRSGDMRGGGVGRGGEGEGGERTGGSGGITGGRMSSGRAFGARPTRFTFFEDLPDED